MQQNKFDRTSYLATIAAVFAMSLGAFDVAAAENQRTFATPKQAADSLLKAAEAGNRPELMALFGPEAEQLVNSGDAVEDKTNIDRFVAKAKAAMKERIDPANANRAVLLIGADKFPFPIPLVRKAGRWRFDTAAGKHEVLARRVGSNEVDAIATCRAYVDAQLDYATEDRNHNGVPEYARKLISSPNQRDGLFWPGPDTPPTSFAAGVQKAKAEGYRKTADQPAPYHGYYYRILTEQGPNAHGGALQYIQHGSMIGGFAMVAWPAEYRVSGVKTFLVNQDGVVYQKDLGPSTSTAAQAISAFNPDKTWHRVP
jgi:hypothetical protein